MKKTLFIAMIIHFISSILIAQSTDVLNIIKSIDGPGSYEILNQPNEPKIIPFRMHRGKPLLDVEINDAKATLMIDNGVLWDQVWLFGSPLVEELQLKQLNEGDLEGAGEGNPTQLYSSSNLTLIFDDIIFYDQPVLVSPPAAGFARMFPGVDGQLSSTFFKHFVVEFDFINNYIILHNPCNYNYKGHGSKIDMKKNGLGTYSIPFTVTLDNKTYIDSVDIDFGGIYALKIALNTKHNIQIPENAEERPSFGNAKEYICKIIKMKIGQYEFNNPTVVFGDENTSRIHPMNLGVIGLPLFQNFNTIFDYFNNYIYLEPNENYNTQFKK